LTLLDGAAWTGITTAARRARRRLMTMVDQDPLSSFDPRWNAERILLDAISRQDSPAEAERAARALELAGQVGLEAEHLSKHPLQLSGGQRQRLAIARALRRSPKSDSRGAGSCIGYQCRGLPDGTQVELGVEP
jgi:peptide/nickel transport system ATP-binding protein